MASNVVEMGSGSNAADSKTEELLIECKRELHFRLGETTAKLIEAQREYTDTIAAIIETNRLLKEGNIDTYPLACELQAEIRPGSAIDGYGQGDMDPLSAA